MANLSSILNFAHLVGTTVVFLIFVADTCSPWGNLLYNTPYQNHYYKIGLYCIKPNHCHYLAICEIHHSVVHCGVFLCLLRIIMSHFLLNSRLLNSSGRLIMHGSQ